MRLEGTLDAFSLPDIFQLLSYTKKTGTLHLRRGTEDHGVVHLHDGLVTGARSDVRRQALARRIVGSGLVDDAGLEAAVAEAQQSQTGLARALVDGDFVAADQLRPLALEQATDAVFDLMRWPEGEFAFVVDEGNPDEVGATQAVEEVVAEARRRLEAWQASAAPAPDALVSIVTSPDTDPVLTRAEWSLLALVDGRRTVGDLVGLAGRGEFTVVSALTALAERGLLSFDAPAAQLTVRQQLLAQLEGDVTSAFLSAEPVVEIAPEPAPEPVTAPEPPPAPRAAAPSAPSAPVRAAVIPERPEPFTPARQPDHAEPEPAYARSGATAQRVAAGIAAASSSSVGSSSVGEVHGAVAMQPAPDQQPAASSAIERDPSVNKSLLLRLIAGVRGL